MVPPVSFPIMVNFVVVATVTFLAVIINDVPAATAALADTASPMNLGAVTADPGPVPVNVATVESNKIAVYPRDEFNAVTVVCCPAWVVCGLTVCVDPAPVKLIDVTPRETIGRQDVTT